VVAEVSCFQLWTSPSFHPRVAILTNLAPDHLDYYDGSYDRYQAAKAALFANHAADDVLVLNADDPILRTWTAPNNARTLWFSKTPLPPGQNGVFLEEQTLFWQQSDTREALVDVHELRLPGSHNIENAMAAACGALAFGLPRQSVQQALREFGGLEHRIERIRTVDGVTYYNDSKATNPHAGEAALRAFDDHIVLLCGGSEKGSDFSDWATLAVDRVRHAVCFGATAQRIAEALGDRIPVTCVETMSAALSVGKEAANGRGVVVLSPVCASFDQFDNFEHRGRVFKALVEAL
jgi:UDP-N-acetylmuramoylalanine--D-glutamate ligase